MGRQSPDCPTRPRFYVPFGTCVTKTQCISVLTRLGLRARRGSSSAENVKAQAAKRHVDRRPAASSFQDTRPGQAGMSHRNAIMQSLGAKAVVLSVCQLLLLPASRGMSGEHPIAASVAVAGGDVPASPLQPARLPRVDTVSYAAATTEPSVERSSLFVGYDDGFVIAHDGQGNSSAVELPFLIRLNSWCQLRHTRFESDGPNPDQNTFSFERLRLAFRGHVLAPDLQYFLQLDGNSDRSTEAIFLDYYISYDLGRHLLCWEAGRLGIRAGKWKLPFSRSREESGSRLQFTDRATANIFFDLNRSIGAGLFGRLDLFALPVHWQTALFNGFRTGNTGTDREDGLDRNFGWSLRSHSDLFGEFGNDGEPDLSYRGVPALRVGSAFAFTRIDETGANEFDRQRVVDSGATLASLLPAGVGAYDIWFYTVDAHGKYCGLSVIAEYFWRPRRAISRRADSEPHRPGICAADGLFRLSQEAGTALSLVAHCGQFGNAGGGPAEFGRVGSGPGLVPGRPRRQAGLRPDARQRRTGQQFPVGPASG